MAISTSQSNGFCEEILQQFLFSKEISENDRQRSQQLQTLVSSSLELVEMNRIQVQQALANCQQKTSELVTKIQKYVSNLTIKFMNDEIQDADFNKGNFLMSMTQEVNKRHFESARQLMQISQLCQERSLQQDLAVMEAFFLERVKELEISATHIDILVQQQNHELEMQEIVHQQKLKQESQSFDQFLRTVKFIDQKRQTEVDNEMRVREQQRLDDVAYQAIAAKRSQIQEQHAREIAWVKRA